jgi:hypothetical protein
VPPSVDYMYARSHMIPVYSYQLEDKNPTSFKNYLEKWYNEKNIDIPKEYIVYNYFLILRCTVNKISQLNLEDVVIGNCKFEIISFVASSGNHATAYCKTADGWILCNSFNSANEKVTVKENIISINQYIRFIVLRRTLVPKTCFIMLLIKFD